MKNWIAIVSSSDNKVTKYQDFDTEDEAKTHITSYGGFVVAKPDGLDDMTDYWVVNNSNKTLGYDSDTKTSNNIAANWARLRGERDVKLAQSDWMSFSDSPTMSDAWKTYRQELRDLPGTLNDTTVQETITWPTEPS